MSEEMVDMTCLVKEAAKHYELQDGVHVCISKVIFGLPIIIEVYANESEIKRIERKTI